MIAMSSKHWVFCSPKEGALIAATLIIPDSLFLVKVANASSSTSSAIINNGKSSFTALKHTLKSSLGSEIILSTNRIYKKQNITLEIIQQSDVCASSDAVAWGDMMEISALPYSQCTPRTYLHV